VAGGGRRGSIGVLTICLLFVIHHSSLTNPRW